MPSRSPSIFSEIRTRWTDWDWHGARLFNLRSPSSHPDLVKRIVEEFVVPAGPDARILDVGGTRQGFIAHLDGYAHELGTRTFLVNPRGGEEIHFRNLAEVPADDAPFDLAMMFGVMVYLEEPQLIDTLRRIHGLLRPGGALLVSDPDGGKLTNRLERPIKPIFGLPNDMYSEAEVLEHMRSVGFVRCARRPDLSGSRRYLSVVGYRGTE